MIEFNYFVENDMHEYTATRSICMNVETDGQTMDDIIAAFQDFLAATGFVIDPLTQKLMLVENKDGAF